MNQFHSNTKQAVAIPPTLSIEQARSLVAQAVELGKLNDLAARVGRGLSRTDALPLVRVNNFRTMAQALNETAVSA